MSRLLAIACSPIGPFPGGELSGSVQPHRGNWSAARDIQTVQIETRPEDPYSINIWGVGEGSNFYIGVGRGDESAWVIHLLENPEIRLRLGDELYLLKAVRVSNAAEQARVGVFYAEKYEAFEADDFVPGEMVLLRLDPR